MQVHGSIHTLRIRATFEEVCFWEKIITFYLTTFGSLIWPRRLHNSHVPIFSAPIWPRERQINSWKGSFFLKSSCDSQNLLFFWPRTLNGQLAFGWSIIQKLWMVIDWLTSHKYPTLAASAAQHSVGEIWKFIITKVKFVILNRTRVIDQNRREQWSYYFRGQTFLFKRISSPR